MADEIPTIRDTLVELRNQNALIRQANVEARAAEKARADSEQVNRAKREWVTEEAQKMEKCEGLPASSMRTWLRAMTSAMTRTPQINRNAVQNPDAVQAEVDLDLGKKLIARAARGSLTIEADKLVAAHPEFPILDILEELETLFLGADEPAARRSELEDLRQQAGNKTENQVPAYCRLFLQKADEAYGVINRGAETESRLAELFITSLQSEEIAREIFEHDPPLETLDEVQKRAIEIYNRSRRMSRAWKGRRKGGQTTRRETPMEIGQLDGGNQQALLNRIQQLEKELGSLKVGAKASGSSTPQSKSKPKPQGQATSYNGPRTAGPKSQCYECGRLGHFGRDCEQRAQRLAREAAAADQE